MYYANCEWYVDMGEHNKPLCERKGLRPAKCSECPVYIGIIEGENARLRELVRKWYPHMARRVDKDALAQWGQLDVLRELGIGADDDD